jgi:hypothetical protein
VGADDRRAGVCMNPMRLADLDPNQAGIGQRSFELAAR